MSARARVQTRLCSALMYLLITYWLKNKWTYAKINRSSSVHMYTIQHNVYMKGSEQKATRLILNWAKLLQIFVQRKKETILFQWKRGTRKKNKIEIIIHLRSLWRMGQHNCFLLFFRWNFFFCTFPLVKSITYFCYDAFICEYVI